MKKNIVWVLILIFLSIVFWFFYDVNEKNLAVFKEIKQNVVKHPESLPTSTLANATSFGFKNAKADFYRLEAIQYIWGNVLSAEYKKYLYKMLNLITDLNPYFEWPYFIGELLLPSYNYRYENLGAQQQDSYTQQWKLIGEKWITNLCDKEKLQLIKQEFDLPKLWSETKYKDPCVGYKVPYFLAYLYYFSLHKPETSAFFYKVSSAVSDWIQWAKVMAAIMQGKSGDREKSIYMFLNLARNLDNDEACITFSAEIEKSLNMLNSTNTAINWQYITSLSTLSKEVFGEFSEEREQEFFDDTKCVSFLYKAMREINLLYLEQANKNYFEKNEKNAENAKELYNNGFIDVLPIDFQQYTDRWYWVEYFYNKDTKKFDYKIDYPQ